MTMVRCNDKLLMVNDKGGSFGHISSTSIYSMRENIVKVKSFAFAIRIVKLYQYLCNEKREFVLSKQLLRSGTSVGAMIREAEHAETKADFKHNMAIG